MAIKKFESNCEQSPQDTISQNSELDLCMKPNFWAQITSSLQLFRNFVEVAGDLRT